MHKYKHSQIWRINISTPKYGVYFVPEWDYIGYYGHFMSFTWIVYMYVFKTSLVQESSQNENTFLQVFSHFCCFDDLKMESLLTDMDEIQQIILFWSSRSQWEFTRKFVRRFDTLFEQWSMWWKANLSWQQISLRLKTNSYLNALTADFKIHFNPLQWFFINRYLKLKVFLKGQNLIDVWSVCLERT